MARLLAYKVTESNDPKDHPVGRVFLVVKWMGKRHEWMAYDRETLKFTRRFTARYLGPVTATTDKGKIRQLFALPGTSHLRKRSA